MTKPIQPPAYRVPTHYASVSVDLDEFSNTEIAEYLRRQGYTVYGESTQGGEGETLVIGAEDLARWFTLALCGQAAIAREEVLRMVSEHIGRPL